MDFTDATDALDASSARSLAVCRRFPSSRSHNLVNLYLEPGYFHPDGSGDLEPRAPRWFSRLDDRGWGLTTRVGTIESRRFNVRRKQCRDSELESRGGSRWTIEARCVWKRAISI